MTTPDILASFRHRTAVVATMHGKEEIIAPLMTDALGLSLMVPTGFNTDRFGTFTRDVARTGNQLQAARQKALAAMAQTGTDLGIASEGSFGTHPAIPFLPSNLEIIVFIDTKNQLEIVGQYRTSKLRVQTHYAETAAAVITQALAWGFPEQGVILRWRENSRYFIYKELTTPEALHDAAETLLKKWFIGRVWIETDMRAHRCPARRQSIKEATKNLITAIQSTCPECGCPGYTITSVVPGLPCRICGLPTDQTKATILSCNKCHHREERPVTDAVDAEPSDCTYCNP
jgi:hypothetical protein